MVIKKFSKFVYDDYDVDKSRKKTCISQAIRYRELQRLGVGLVCDKMPNGSVSSRSRSESFRAHPCSWITKAVRFREITAAVVGVTPIRSRVERLIMTLSSWRKPQPDMLFVLRAINNPNATRTAYVKHNVMCV